MIMKLSETEIMVLAAISRLNYMDFRHQIGVFKRLHSLGYIKVIYDEQGNVISATITSNGRKVLATM